MAAILDLSNMAATEGAHLGSLEKLVGDGPISPWYKNGACGTMWTIIRLSPLTITVTDKMVREISLKVREKSWDLFFNFFCWNPENTTRHMRVICHTTNPTFCIISCQISVSLLIKLSATWCIWSVVNYNLPYLSNKMLNYGVVLNANVDSVNL